MTGETGKSPLPRWRNTTAHSEPTERNLDEWADHLTSLRMGGKQRLWGFLRAGVFHVLWWDPEHQIYPSWEKHT